MRVDQQIRTFEQILKAYDGKLPLHRFLVAHYKANKQMGSSDRRWASRYLYSYFRLGKAIIGEDPITRLAVSDFLCHDTLSLVVEHRLPDFKEHIQTALADKLQLVQQRFPKFKTGDVFKLINHLSADIDTELFLESFFTQPDLFIRSDDKSIKDIHQMLSADDVEVTSLGSHTLAMPNGTKLEQLLPSGYHYQVQDLSSQRTGEYFQPQPYDYWWDCCAASGGKSLLLHGLEPKIQLLVSDVRESSLHNLDERFQLAGLRKYQKKALDLLQNNDADMHDYEFDGIILDAPCSGSGTWGRTPEMLSYFEDHKIEYFSKLQKSIASNVVQYLKKDKPLIYITCSVFAEENEEVVAFLEKNAGLKLEKKELLCGYTEKADTMFVARFTKL
ncbi:MAG: RsmB/NOP family class I SAM-dependent RNA methyltransferase [Pedobacter sp.]|nr:MAG: RsmB/NOP family class I SAM-dependent RNA methyltransferase [Pedobacter sp.]